MSEQLGLSVAEQTLAKVNALVDESYLNPCRETRDNALQASLQYFATRKPRTHIFCDPINDKPAVTTLLIFAYPNTKHLSAYTQTLAAELSQCSKCPRRYHLALYKFRRIVSNAYGLDDSSTTELMVLIGRWNRTRLLNSIQTTYRKMSGMQNPSPLNFQQELIPLFECLCAPRLLKDLSLLEIFKKVFFGIQKASGNVVLLPDLLPGVISFLFSANEAPHHWASQVIGKMSDNMYVASNFDEMQVQALEDVVRDCMSVNSGEDVLKRFWYTFSILLRLLDKSVFVERLCSKPFDIVKFLDTCIMKRPGISLPATLLAFSNILYKCESDYWKIVQPTSITDVVNAIVQNPYFENPDAWAQESGNSNDFVQNSTDVSIWIMSLLDSEQPDLKPQCGNLIIPKLMDIHTQMPEIPQKENVLSELLDVFADSLLVPIGSSVPFADKSLLIRRTQVMNYCNQFGYQLIEGYLKFKNTNEYINAAGLATIYRMILLDVTLGLPQSTDLQHIDETALENLTNNSLWEQLSVNMPADAAIAIRVLRAISLIPFMTHPPTTTKPLDRSQLKYSEKVVQCTLHSLRSICNFPLELLAVVLADDNALLSIILNLYAVDQSVPRFAINIICHAYDATDRMTALSLMFHADVQRTLKLFAMATEKIQSVGLFSPCPKFLKVAKDISRILFGAQTPLKRFEDFLPGPDNELAIYWNKTWSALKFMFRNLQEWSSIFRRDVILEFSRDLLEYAMDLLQNFRLVNSLISESNNNHESAFLPVVSCVREMLVLLDPKQDPWIVMTLFDVIIELMNVMKVFKVHSDALKVRTIVSIFKKFQKKFQGQKYGPSVLWDDKYGSLLLAAGEVTPSKPNFISKNVEKSPLPPPVLSTQPLLIGNGENSLESASAALPVETGDTNSSKRAHTQGSPMDTKASDTDSSSSDSDASSSDSNSSDESDDESFETPSYIPVDMEPLHEEILAWDYHSKTPAPSNINTRKSISIPDVIPTTFGSVIEYQKIFWPNLLVLCWQLILSLKSSAETPFMVNLGPRIPVSPKKEIFDFKVTITAQEEEHHLKEADLLVLSYFPPSELTSRYPHPESPYCFARVQQVRSSPPLLTEFTLRVIDPPSNIKEHLSAGSQLHALKAANLATVEADYRALLALPRYGDLVEPILKAEPYDGGVESISKGMIERLRDKFKLLKGKSNGSQVKAIVASRHAKGFSIIQG